MDFDATTLHTNEGCSMAKESPALFTGVWATAIDGVSNATNCWVDAPGQFAMGV